MNKITNKIIFSFLILTTYAIFAEAANLEVEGTKKIEIEKPEVKAMIQAEVKKQVKSEISEIKKDIVATVTKVTKVSEKTEKEKEEEILFNKIKFARSEIERVKNYYSLSEDDQEKIQEIIKKHKTEKIFSQFDFIINKLDDVKNNINTNINLLKKNNIELSDLDNSLLELDTNIDQAKKSRADAWIKMQKIDFADKDKKAILEQLKLVRSDLLLSKESIKKSYMISKEIIFFIKGALANLK